MTATEQGQVAETLAPYVELWTRTPIVTAAVPGTPEHLRHHEHGIKPFAPAELAAIAEYENGADPEAGAQVLRDCLDVVDFDPITTDGGEVVVDTTHQVLAAFGYLSEWYGLLDSLKSGLRRVYGSEDGVPVVGPAHSVAAVRYMTAACNRWYRKLHEVRREACRQAYGTAGPTPEVDSGNLTFFDIPGIQLDGTIAAESQ